MKGQNSVTKITKNSPVTCRRGPYILDNAMGSIDTAGLNVNCFGSGSKASFVNGTPRCRTQWLPGGPP